MKKWFFILQNALLSAACAVLFSTAFVACSDYQDDIDDLWDQVDKNTEELRNREAQLAKLQAAYDAGVVITSITSDNNGGIIVTTSSGDTYNIKKGDKGEQGQSITGPQGPIGPRGFVPTFSIDGNGNLIATWPEEADREPDNLGQVVSEIPELEFSINEEGHLIYNGQDLGNVIGPKGEDGETTVIDNKPTISFAITDAGNLTVTVDGETTDLGNVTGPQGPAGTLPSLSFSINDNGNLIAQFGNETIDCGQVKGEFKIENGGYYYNGEKLGDLTLSDVDFEVIDDYLYIAGNKTDYIMNQNIFLVDGEKTATLNLPVYNEDGEYEGQYQSVELLKAGSVEGDIEEINYKLLQMIQSIEFVPEFADPSVFRPMGYAMQNVLYAKDGSVLRSSAMNLEFKVTPRAAAQVVADLFEQDPTAVTLHQQNFPWPTRDYVGQLEIDSISKVDAERGTFVVYSSADLEGNFIDPRMEVRGRIPVNQPVVAEEYELPTLYLEIYDESRNIDIASQYVPVQINSFYVYDVYVEKLSGDSENHELCYDSEGASFDLLASNYEVRIETGYDYETDEETYATFEELGFAPAAIVFESEDGKVVLTETEDGVSVSLPGNDPDYFGKGFDYVYAGADIDGDGEGDIYADAEEVVDVTRCTLSGEATVDLTYVWSLDAIEEEIVDYASLSTMATFFNMTVEELKDAIDNQEIVFSSESGDEVTIAAPYVDVNVAANTPPAEDAYTASATYTYTPGEYPESPWVFTVNVNVTIVKPEDACLLQAEAWWVNDKKDLRIGTYEVDEEDGLRYVAYLNNAFKLDFLNDDCAFFAQLSADSRAIPGVRIEQEEDPKNAEQPLYKIIFTSQYSLADSVHVDFKSISKDLQSDLAAWEAENPEPTVPSEETTSIEAFAATAEGADYTEQSQSTGAWRLIRDWVGGYVWQGGHWETNAAAQEAYDAWVKQIFDTHSAWMEAREAFIDEYYSDGGYAVVCEMDNVWVVFPIPFGKLEAGNETLVWGNSPIELGESVNLYSSVASGEKLLWNGAEGSTEDNVYGDPTVDYNFTIPADIYPNLTFDEDAVIITPEDPDGDYIVTCTSIGMASPWENPEEIVLKGKAVVEHNWMEKGGASVDYTVTIPANSANAPVPGE